MLNQKQLKKMLTELGYSGATLDKNLQALLSIGGDGSGSGTTYTFKAPLGVSASNEVSINLAGYVTTTTLNSALGNFVPKTTLGNEMRNAVGENTSLQNAIKDVALPSIVGSDDISVNYNNIENKLNIDFSQKFLNSILQYKDNNVVTDLNDATLDGAIYSFSNGQTSNLANAPAVMPTTFISLVNKEDNTSNFYGLHFAFGKELTSGKTNVFLRTFSDVEGVNSEPSNRQFEPWVRLLPEEELVDKVLSIDSYASVSKIKELFLASEVLIQDRVYTGIGVNTINVYTQTDNPEFYTNNKIQPLFFKLRFKIQNANAGAVPSFVLPDYNDQTLTFSYVDPFGNAEVSNLSVRDLLQAYNGSLADFFEQDIIEISNSNVSGASQVDILAPAGVLMVDENRNQVIASFRLNAGASASARIALAQDGSAYYVIQGI